MGAYIGKTAYDEKLGRGVLVDYHYADGKDYQPTDEEVKKLRPRQRTDFASAKMPPPALQRWLFHLRKHYVELQELRSMSASGLLAQLLNGLASASSLFLVSVGLSLIFGVTRTINFAHGSFYMLGAFIAYSSVDLLAPYRLLARAAAGSAGLRRCSGR
jgi:hypothetical protein